MPLLHTSTIARSEPAWASVDQASLPDEAFVADRRLGHHWVKGGSLHLHLGGLVAAWAEANRIGAGPAELAHLRRHFADIGLRSAREGGVTYDLTELDAPLVRTGFLSVSDLEPDLAAMSLRLAGGE